MPKIPLRKIRVKGNIAHVPLNRGYTAIIDAEDVPLVVGYNWTVRVHRDLRYAYRTERQGGKQRRIHMHRVIANTPPNYFTDHRDGDGLNNRRCNLRTADICENRQNSPAHKTNTSGFKGVQKIKNRDRWLSTITARGINYYLGTFKTAEEAHAAYCEAAHRLHGEFARTE
jgi:hypothetical protein